MLEENKNLENQKSKKKSWAKWLCLFIITWIILELMALIPRTTGNILIFGPIIVGFTLLASILVPLGIILFFIKWPKSRKTKIITFFILLLLIFRAFPGTYLGSVIVYAPINGLRGLQAKIIEKEVMRAGDPEKCFKIGKGPIWEFLYSFPLDLDGLGRTPFAYGIKCVIDFAVMKKDETFCKLFKEKEEDYLFDWCFSEVAIAKAIAKKDSKICENVSDSSLRNKCYKAVGLEIEAQEKPFLEECSRLSQSPGFARDICIRNFAIQKRDRELCKYLEYKGHQRPCELDIKILTEEILNPCQKFLTIAYTPIPDSYFSTSDRMKEKKEECVRDIAIETSDIQLCTFLDASVGTLRNKCFYEIILRGELDNLELCKEMPSEETKEICFAAVSVNKNDLEMCKEYGGKFYNDCCYRGIAVKRNDPDICKIIAGEGTRHGCFRDIAVKTNNIEICNEIEMKYDREQCQKEVEELR